MPTNFGEIPAAPTSRAKNGKGEALLIVITALGVWLGLWTHSARRHQRAVEALRATGDVAIYDDCDLDRPKRWDRPSQLPDIGKRWLERLIGIDYLHTVKVVIIEGASFGDDDLANLRSLPVLEIVHIDHASIEGDGLRHLKPLSGLIELYIFDTPLTDACLVHVSQLTSLETLGLVDTEITDSAPTQKKALNQQRRRVGARRLY